MANQYPSHHWNPSKVKRRYAIFYYHLVGDYSRQDTAGSTNNLARAIGHAVMHCAMSELIEGEYAQALVIDRKQNALVRSYRRSAGGSIQVKVFNANP